MEERIMTHDEYVSELKDALSRGSVTVRFRKVNGEERIMNCTLNPSVVPQYVGTGTSRKKSDGVIAVWDLDNSGWRSFRVDSLISFCN
jgi:hypothetical protein